MTPHELYPLLGHSSPELIYKAIYGTAPTAGSLFERVRAASSTVDYGVTVTATEPTAAEAAALADAQAAVDDALVDALTEQTEPQEEPARDDR